MVVCNSYMWLNIMFPWENGVCHYIRKTDLELVLVELETWYYGFCTVMFNSLLLTKLCSILQLKGIKF